MCIVCGNMEHMGLELIEKATLTDLKKKPKKEFPRYKALSDLEADFKNDYVSVVGDMLKELIEEAKK